MSWFVLWIAGALINALGFLMLYLPSNVEVAKGAGPSPYLPQVAYPLMVAGAVGIVVGLIGIVESHSRQAAGVGQTRRPGLRGTTRAMSGRVADAAALAGLVVAVAALLAASLVFIVAPILVSLQGPGPCGPSTFLPNHSDTACFSAHPDYYHYDPVAGSASTPVSRLYDSLTPVLFRTAWPLALGAGLISCLALAMGTGRRRAALSALSLGSLVVSGLVAMELLFIVAGGD